MKKSFTKLSLAASSLVASAAFPMQAMAGAIDTGQTIDPGKGFATDIGQLINGALSFVMVIGALLVFGYLIMGGIEWITSGGDKTKTEGARNKITAAVIGLIILAASYAILIIILNFLGFSDLGAVFSNVKGL
jgi:cytochrome bd-type quinol oxidase subunit 2